MHTFFHNGTKLIMTSKTKQHLIISFIVFNAGKIFECIQLAIHKRSTAIVLITIPSSWLFEFPYFLRLLVELWNKFVAYPGSTYKIRIMCILAILTILGTISPYHKNQTTIGRNDYLLKIHNFLTTYFTVIFETLPTNFFQFEAYSDFLFKRVVLPVLTKQLYEFVILKGFRKWSSAV